MNRREAEELLPWYVAGTLTEAEARGVEAFIESGEIARASLDELALLRESVQTVGAEEPRYDGAVLDRAMARLDAVPQLPPEAPIVVRVPVGQSTRRAGVFAKLLERLEWSLTPPLARIAIAAQLILVIGLGAALLLRPEALEPASHEVAGHATVGDFSVAFAPDAAESQIRALLIECNVSIVAGPSALGVYTLDVAEGVDPAAARVRLESSPLVRLLQGVPR